MLAAAVAFGAPQLWGSRDWSETDTRLIALLERQLDRIGDSDTPRRIRILATLAGELAIIGVGVDCGGAVDRLLAGLAWRLGHLDEAAERAQAGLALETRVGSGTWIARTKDLIEKITAASGASAHPAGVKHNHGSALRSQPG